MPKYKRSFDVLFSNYRKELFVKLENLNKQNKNLNKNYKVFYRLTFFLKVIRFFIVNIRSFNHQYKLLRKPLFDCDVIVINGKRDLINYKSHDNLSEYLSNLLYSQQNPNNKLSSCIKNTKSLLIIDSGFISPLWSKKRLKNNIIIDDIFLIFLFLKHPKNICIYIYSLFFKNRIFKINLALLASNFYRISLIFLKSKLKINSYIMTTSNSFKVEFFRYHIPKVFNLDNIYEVAHGIPDIATEKYIHEFYQFNDSKNSIKLNFTFQIPGLEAHTTNNNVKTEKYFINLSFNKHLIKNNFSKIEITKSVISLFNEIFNIEFRSYNGLFISYFGGVPFDNDVVGSGMLNSEIKLCNKVINYLKKENVEFKLVYFPHPSLDFEFMKKHFSKHQIKVSRETFVGFYLSDLCISHYSSTLWEAKFFGCKIFSTASKMKSLFSNNLLNYISHDLNLNRTLLEVINKNNITTNLSSRLDSRINKLLNFN